MGQFWRFYTYAFVHAGTGFCWSSWAHRRDINMYKLSNFSFLIIKNMIVQDYENMFKNYENTNNIFGMAKLAAHHYIIWKIQNYSSPIFFNWTVISAQSCTDHVLTHTIIIITIIFYWLLPEMCAVLNLEANWSKLYQGAHDVTNIIK